jgi:uncharacterized protein (DUF433 family)
VKLQIRVPYPTLELEDIEAVLRFAAAMMEAKYEIKQLV